MEENSTKKRGKGGRPPKPDSEKLSVRHNLKISIDDELRLQEDYTLVKQGRVLPFEMYLRERLLQSIPGTLSQSKTVAVKRALIKRMSVVNMNSLLVTLVDLKRTLQEVVTKHNQSARLSSELPIHKILKSESNQSINLSSSADDLIREIKLIIHRIKQTVDD